MADEDDSPLLDLDQVYADPEFRRKPSPVKKQILDHIDPQFRKLSPKAKEEVLQHILRQTPMQPKGSWQSGMKKRKVAAAPASVTVETKQDPVEYIPSPQPRALTPPPDLSPYEVDIEAKQPSVEPIRSATDARLFGVPLRSFQPPERAPAGPPPPLDEPPVPKPRPRTFQPPERAPMAGQPSLGEPPVPRFRPPEPDSESMRPATRRPLRAFQPPEGPTSGGTRFNTPIPAEPPVPKLKPPEPDSGFATRMPARQPLRPFTPPESRPSEPVSPPVFGEPPVPSAAPVPSPSRQILRAIGIPEPAHKALEPRVARTFPKAIAPAKPTAAPGRLTPPPKTFRATPSTVSSAFQFSPLRQAEHRTGRKVVVSLPDKKVVVYDNHGVILREYSAYVGRAATPTPRGQFRIMENIKPAESEWYYGGHWMGFARDYQKYKGEPPPYAGFHGWVYDKQDELMEKEDPGWKTSTGGCIQLSNRDVADLASLVGAGDPVTVLDTPFAPPPPRPPVPRLSPVGVGSFLQSLVPATWRP